MGIGGLAARAALLKEQLRQKPCPRCGLHYDPVKLAQCPHCGNLDERGLARLLEQREARFEANRALSIRFFVVALILLLVMIAVLSN